MKQFLIVLQFELMHFFKNKAYIVTTTLLSVLLAGILCAPMVMQMFSSDDTEETPSGEKSEYVIAGDEANLPAQQLLTVLFEDGNFTFKSNAEEVKEAVKNGDAQAGFIVDSLTSYQYVVNNTSMSDVTQQKFNEVMKKNYQFRKTQELGIDYAQVDEIYQTPMQSEAIVLGKDGVSNYFYTYILIFALYFLIIFYGQLIASGVASEKSNRAIEVLVTSARPNCLIFGKVIAGALAGIIQFGIILASCGISYQFAKDAWGGALDMLFNIPMEAILSFSAFGILGYLFYSFIFGAIGALASKTEDINSSSTPITIIFVISFMVTSFGMNNTDSIMMVIASYVPFSSFMSMFVRVAMGSVSMVEVAISLLILAGSTIFIGMMAAKIYRMGTLRYGNPIKMKDAIKQLKNSK